MSKAPPQADPPMTAQTSPSLQANLLGDETSPYLLQHQDNPVHWRAWGPAAFEEARTSGKPILLSVGYAACHWCHVMAHESFEDEATAAVMNDLFVNIKVDREERPDVDHIYQAALAAMGEQGGWPLTMFLTPDAEPFWGGTYFPPEPRYGRPGFKEILNGVSTVYKTEPEKVAHNRKALGEALQQLAEARPGDTEVDPVILVRMAERLVQEIDPVHGGVGHAPKFPNTNILTFLWRTYLRTGERDYAEAVMRSLIAMCQGGIYDHLGGGFARYATDMAWLVPHFEKMLYDNALLMELMLSVERALSADLSREPGAGSDAATLFRTRIAETAAWALREMATEGGGFSAAIDADSEGEEGKFYVWQEAEIDALLGDRSAPFKAVYDVTAIGNWEGVNILNRRGQVAGGAAAYTLLGDETEEAALARDRAVLFEARAARIPPGLDDKVLADWNGMMIAALAKAGFAYEEAEWIAAAERAFEHVVSALGHEDGRLRHSYRNGQTRGLGVLDDYAQMARAGIALFEATGEPGYLDYAERWADTLHTHFWDGEAGGYFTADTECSDLIVRARHANDQATPSGNGTMVEVLERLYHLTGKPVYRDRQMALIAAFSGEIERNFFPLATFLTNVAQGGAMTQLVLATGDGAHDASAMTAALRAADPGLTIRWMADTGTLPEAHPAARKGPVDGAAALYICENMTCGLPLTNPEEAAAAVRPRAAKSED